MHISRIHFDLFGFEGLLINLILHKAAAAKFDLDVDVPNDQFLFLGLELLFL
jgi:hypothetical protein